MPKKPMPDAGTTPAAPDHATTGVRIDTELVRKLRVIAANEETTIKDLLGEAAKRVIEEWEIKNRMRITFDRKR